MMYEEQALRAQICETGRALLETGLVARTWGNVSARVDQTHFLVTPSGLDYLRITPDDLAVCDCESGSWTGQRKPSGERGVHAAAYRLYPEVQFVIHTHQTYATALSLAGYRPGCFTAEERHALGGVSVAQYALTGTRQLQAAIVNAMAGGARTILMAHHGALLCARSQQKAMEMAQTLEQASRRCWQGVLEQVEPLEPQWLASLLAKLHHTHPLARAVQTDALLTHAALARPIRAQLDDMAQMIGLRIPLAACSASSIAQALDRHAAVLVPGIGAIVCGKDADDTEALGQLADKAAICALHTAALGQDCRLSALDCGLQHLVYQKKYAKQKEASL